MSLVGTTSADIDRFYIIDCEEWYEAINDGCMCALAKAECGGEGEIDGEEGKEVDGLD